MTFVGQSQSINEQITANTISKRTDDRHRIMDLNIYLYIYKH